MRAMCPSQGLMRSRPFVRWMNAAPASTHSTLGSLPTPGTRGRWACGAWGKAAQVNGGVNIRQIAAQPAAPRDIFFPASRIHSIIFVILLGDLGQSRARSILDARQGLARLRCLRMPHELSQIHGAFDLCAV